MTEEEAIEQLISLKENAKVNIDTDEIFRLDYEEIKTVLNLLEKKDKIIELLTEDLSKEYKTYEICPTKQKCEGHNNCKSCIKEHCRKKVENGIQS